MACINPNSPEFKEILLKVNNPLLAEIEMDKSITTDDITSIKNNVSNNNTSSINNPTIQEATIWIKSVMPDANIELVNELVDDIGIGSYDTIKDLITLSEKYANKRTAKHEVFHKSFNSLSEEKQEKLLEEGSKLFGISRGESKVTVKYSKVEQKSIDYMLKSVDILQSAKAIQTFEKGNKNKWNLDKILTELSIPKEQKQLIIDLDKTNREEIITDLLANYSYTIEINTAKQGDKENISTYYNEETGTIEEADFGSTIRNSEYYSNLTVPGGTNYTENEIATPAITPSIKGHAQFATDNGIGWFRSDDATTGDKNKNYGEYEDDVLGSIYEGFQEQGLNISFEEFKKEYKKQNAGKLLDTKTRRILEIQSDLFQKGRDSKYLDKNAEKDIIIPIEESVLPYIGKGYYVAERNNENITLKKNNLGDTTSNQFLQLLNKDNNWVTFFVRAIIQDSAHKGYEKVLFPTGNTASKVEGHTTLEEFKKQIEDRIKELEKQKKEGKNTIEKYLTGINDLPYTSTEVSIDIEINQLKQELETVEREGFGALKPIYNFYENTVTNILNKQFGKENVKIITDEYGNTWNEIDLLNSKVKEQTSSIKFKSPIISYTGDLAIEEKMAEMMENTPDEKLPKSVIGKWIQSVRNFFRNLFKERTKLQRFMRDINQGRYANQASSGIDNGKKYSQLSKQNIEDLFETDTELADAIYKALGYKEKVANFTTEYNLYDIITLQQKQQAIEIYSQYLQSLNKPNTNPTLQDSQKQVKKFVELQERLNNKEFVKSAKNVYDNSKELQELGTQEQYIDFIARVALGIIRNPSSGEFNNSKVTDVVYHGTGKYNAEEILVNGFDSTLQGENKVIFFTGDESQSFSKLGGKIDAIVNIEQLFNNRFTSLLNKANENPDSFYYPTEADVNSSLYEVIRKRNPGNIFIDKYGKTAEVTVLSSEQIHILSSKQDIDGFKQYISTVDDKAKSEDYDEDMFQKLSSTSSTDEIEYNDKGEVLAPKEFQQSLNKPDTNPILTGNLKPDIILPIGTSGSGKSTWIKSVNTNNQFVVISPDDMRVEFTGDMNDKSKDDEIYQAVTDRAIQAVKEGKQVIVDTTNLKKERRRPFIDAVKKALPNTVIQYKLLPLNPELAKQRIKADIEAGVNRANVPDSTIDKHAKSYNQMLEDIKSEDISNYDYKEEQEKKFKELQEKLQDETFLEAVKSVFNNSSKLQQFAYETFLPNEDTSMKLSSKEEVLSLYTDYVARIALGIIKNPSSGEYNYDSKIKDIVYHRSKLPIVEKFKEMYTAEENSNQQYDTYGTYFTPDISVAKRYNSGQLVSVLYNSTNLRLKDDYFRDFYIITDKPIEDAYYHKESNEYVFFNPNQIHILDSIQDIEGFEKYIFNKSKQSPVEVLDNTEEIAEADNSPVSTILKKEVIQLPKTAQLILPIGISGSGKSTWIDSLDKDKYTIISPDLIRKELTGNISDQSKNTEVFAMSDKLLDETLKQGKKVILDSTNLNTIYRRSMISKLKSLYPDLDIRYKVLDVDPNIAKQRIATDISNNKDRSNTPNEIIDLQYEQFLQTKLDIKNEPIHEFRDSKSIVTEILDKYFKGKSDVLKRLSDMVAISDSIKTNSFLSNTDNLSQSILTLIQYNRTVGEMLDIYPSFKEVFEGVNKNMKLSDYINTKNIDKKVEDYITNVKKDMTANFNDYEEYLSKLDIDNIEDLENYPNDKLLKDLCTQ